MAFSNLSGWSEMAASAPAYGAGDQNTSEGSVGEKPTACGSACEAGDK